MQFPGHQRISKTSALSRPFGQLFLQENLWSFIEDVVCSQQRPSPLLLALAMHPQSEEEGCVLSARPPAEHDLAFEDYVCYSYRDRSASEKHPSAANRRLDANASSLVSASGALPYASLNCSLPATYEQVRQTVSRRCDPATWSYAYCLV